MGGPGSGIGSGGRRPGAGRPGGRPKGLVSPSTLVYRAAYIRSVTLQARRAWRFERNRAREERKPFTLRRPKRGDLKAAVEFLVKLRFSAIAGALAAGEYAIAIHGIEGIEDRMLGRTYTPHDPKELVADAGSAGKTLVLVMGGNGNNLPLAEFGYAPAPRTLAASTEPEKPPDEPGTKQK